MGPRKALRAGWLNLGRLVRGNRFDVRRSHDLLQVNFTLRSTGLLIQSHIFSIDFCVLQSLLV